MFETVRHYVCSWGWYEALHFWTEIGQTATTILLIILVIKIWWRQNEQDSHRKSFKLWERRQ